MHTRGIRRSHCLTATVRGGSVSAYGRTMMRHLARGLAVLFLLFALGLGQQVAYAAGTVTIQVTTSLDGNDPSPGDGVCNTNATDPARGACSLRAAIQTASSEPTGISVIVSVPASDRKSTR